jgi:hypothetical protein
MKQEKNVSATAQARQRQRDSGKSFILDDMSSQHDSLIRLWHSVWHVLALVSTAYAMVFVLAVQLAQVIAMRMCSWPLSPRSIALPLRRRHVTRQQSGDRSAVDVSFARLLLPLLSLE